VAERASYRPRGQHSPDLLLASPPDVPRASAGFTLVEIALILLIIGFLVALVTQGQQLIRNARVRGLIAQQDAVEAAVRGFEDRYKALPGDYRDASATLQCNPACPNGNGNGRIDVGGAPPEYILVWAHLWGAGFLNAEFSATSATSQPGADNTPRNVYGAYMQVVFDKNWGFSANPVQRHNIKTGNGIPVDAIAEVDRKVDDGLPTSGRLQFSPYAAEGVPPQWGGLAGSCTSQDVSDRSTEWNANSSVGDCGAATLL
jgi:type II secretory pathway pseudopilin PulG